MVNLSATLLILLKLTKSTRTNHINIIITPPIYVIFKRRSSGATSAEYLHLFPCYFRSIAHMACLTTQTVLHPSLGWYLSSLHSHNMTNKPAVSVHNSERLQKDHVAPRGYNNSLAEATFNSVLYLFS